MTRLSLELPASLHTALAHRAALDASSLDEVVISLLRTGLGVTPDAPTSIPPPARLPTFPPSSTLPADPIDDEALALAIRETCSFYEGG